MCVGVRVSRSYEYATIILGVTLAHLRIGMHACAMNFVVTCCARMCHSAHSYTLDEKSTKSQNK